MINHRKIILIAAIVAIGIMAAFGISQSTTCKTFLGNKPWIRNGERKEFYPNGNPRLIQTRRNGKSDGPFTRWYSNGQKQLEIFFSQGKREGKTAGWHENGKKAFDGQFSNGKYEGIWHFYDTNDAQVAEMTCKNGIFWEGTDARYLNGVLQISTYQNGNVVSSEKRKD
ncbi:MAG: hypothetical protein A2283_21040 [Lentisphaerae bacterium RIFOXYA12_FULL_48_11]|nr:MAG: hypothetical protein A2283_21040 [Lentisphaerae bacterium RIFOXYA12_FULL_48_11]